MHRIPYYLIFLLLISCTQAEIDDDKPVIDMSFAGAFPVNCDTIYVGEAFTFRAIFTDNVELGAYSVDIHHNFDHHSHSTEPGTCEPGPEKTPVNPFLFINSYEIPPGSREYNANIEIQVPGDVDPGDYHFFLSLTDRAGWQTVRGVGVKVLYQEFP